MIKFLVCANTPGNKADSDSDCKNPLEPLREPAETSLYSISQVLTSQLNTLFSGNATKPIIISLICYCTVVLTI